MAHDQPTYASVPGIRVFGMMCVKPGVGISTKRKTPQAPKRDQYNNNGATTYQTKYPSQYQPQQQQQQQQHYKQPEVNAYQQSQQNYHQQQYQSNYQYLHRTPVDRPLSTSTPRNMYQPMYQQPPASIHTYNNNDNDNDQYDDVYGRHGAEVEGDTEETGATATGDPKVTPPAPMATASEDNTATQQDPTTYPTSLASNPTGTNDDALTTILATEATVTSTVQQVESRRKRRNANDIDAQIETMIQQLLLNTDLAASHLPQHSHFGTIFETRQ